MSKYRKKLIEVALPLQAINEASVREGYIYRNHPNAIHKWWAQRPLAACRATIFAQLVDDPASVPEEFPSKEDQDRERDRLFSLLRELVTWESTNNERLLAAARAEIAKSVARDQDSSTVPASISQGTASAAETAAYLEISGPILWDPFAGGGSIPLEGQRLGLRTIAADLNPIAVLLNLALTNIPASLGHCESITSAGIGLLKGVAAIAHDVRAYGGWMLEQARPQLQQLYPRISVPGETTTVPPTAWIWARTVRSPDPSANGAMVPLATTWWLYKKKGAWAWVVPNVDPASMDYSFTIATGKPTDPDAIGKGTKVGRGTFKCLLTRAIISPDYIRTEARAGRMGLRLLAVAGKHKSKKFFVAGSEELEAAVECDPPADILETDLPDKALGFRVQKYGMTKHRDLFTARQLVALESLSNLVAIARDKALEDLQSKKGQHNEPTDELYANAIALFLGFAVSKMVDYHCSLIGWYPKEARTGHLFTRHAVPMVWDFVENNPLIEIGGSFAANVKIIADAIEALSASSKGPVGRVEQRDAASSYEVPQNLLVATDPPYYDNVPYADLSDLFYVWLRRSLHAVFPDSLSTVLVPKRQELVADPFRHGDSDTADDFFLEGMNSALRRMGEQTDPRLPICVFYAFKQSETKSGGAYSTGWETFLQALFDSGLGIHGTWPIRTERQGRLRGQASNALASSVLLVCRLRETTSSAVTRGEFRRELREELPAALAALQMSNIAPVDLAQAAIGPGMAIFSGHSQVLEADGTAMTIRSALQQINEALGEFLTSHEADVDDDTRFALTWFAQYRWDSGAFGDAETLAKAKNVSVAGVVDSGIATSSAGKVRLLRPEELSDSWHAERDARLSVWEATHRLVRRLDADGEEAAASLLGELPALRDDIRMLAYLQFEHCSRSNWAEDARLYNGLIVAWTELGRLASQTSPAQPSLLEGS